MVLKEYFSIFAAYPHAFNVLLTACKCPIADSRIQTLHA